MFSLIYQKLSDASETILKNKLKINIKFVINLIIIIFAVLLYFKYSKNTYLSVISFFII